MFLAPINRLACVILFVSTTACASFDGPKPPGAWADWASINTCLSVARIGLVAGRGDANTAVLDRSRALAGDYDPLGRHLARWLAISEQDRQEVISEEVEMRSLPDPSKATMREYAEARNMLMREQLRCVEKLPALQERRRLTW